MQRLLEGMKNLSTSFEAFVVDFEKRAYLATVGPPSSETV